MNGPRKCMECGEMTDINPMPWQRCPRCLTALRVSTEGTEAVSNIDHIPAALAKSISESAEVFEAYRLVRQKRAKLYDANERVSELSRRNDEAQSSLSSAICDCSGIGEELAAAQRALAACLEKLVIGGGT